MTPEQMDDNARCLVLRYGATSLLENPASIEELHFIAPAEIREQLTTRAQVYARRVYELLIPRGDPPERTEGAASVLVIKASGERAVHQITNEMECVRMYFNGGYMEGISGNGWVALVDDEGLIKELPINDLATALARFGGWANPYDALYGPVLFAGPPDRHHNLTDVPQWVLDAAEHLAHLAQLEART